MLKIIKQVLLPIVAIALIWTLLSWEEGHPLPLPQPAGYVLSKDNKDQVYLEAKALNYEESRDYIHKNLLDSGYQPVLLQIDNTSPFSYELKAGETDIPTASAKKIVKGLDPSKWPRAMAYKVLGFLFWPLSIPGTLDTIRTQNREYTLTRELAAKTLKKEGEIIPPYSSLSRVLYVPEMEVKESFQLSLTNLDQNKVEDFFVLIEDVS